MRCWVGAAQGGSGGTTKRIDNLEAQAGRGQVVTAALLGAPNHPACAMQHGARGMPRRQQPGGRRIGLLHGKAQQQGHRFYKTQTNISACLLLCDLGQVQPRLVDDAGAQLISEAHCRQAGHRRRKIWYAKPTTGLAYDRIQAAIRCRTCRFHGTCAKLRGAGPAALAQAAGASRRAACPAEKSKAAWMACASATSSSRVHADASRALLALALAAARQRWAPHQTAAAWAAPPPPPPAWLTHTPRAGTAGPAGGAGGRHEAWSCLLLKGTQQRGPHASWQTHSWPPCKLPSWSGVAPPSAQPPFKRALPGRSVARPALPEPCAGWGAARARALPHQDDSLALPVVQQARH